MDWTVQENVFNCGCRREIAVRTTCLWVELVDLANIAQTPENVRSPMKAAENPHRGKVAIVPNIGRQTVIYRTWEFSKKDRGVLASFHINLSL